MLFKKLSYLALPLVATLSLHANDPFFADPFGDDIFKEMMQMQKEMDKMFERMHNRIEQRSLRQITPLGSYKIAQTSQFVDKGEYYEYVTNIPENKENQIDITAKDGVVHITAKIIEKKENKTANTYSTSSSMRMYQQSIPLPSDTDEGGLSAKYKDGKLVISVKKLKNASTPQSAIRINGVNVAPKKVEKRQENKTNKTKEQNSTKIKINSDTASMS